MEQKNTTVDLDQPIKRGDNDISQLVVRKPAAGELRGVSLKDVLNMEYNAMETVLPRITLPTLTRADIQAMDAADLTQLAVAVAGFLLPKTATEAFL